LGSTGAVPGLLLPAAAPVDPKAVTARQQAELLLKSFGEMFPLALDAVYLDVQRKTTLFDEELKLDVSSARAMKSRELMHVLFLDMYTDEANGVSLNFEGTDLPRFVYEIIVGMPPCSAQQLEQLYDRVNRVDLEEGNQPKMIMHITGHKQLGKESTLGMMGSTELDVVVGGIVTELAAHAVDCEKNRLPSEAAQLRCKKKS